MNPTFDVTVSVWNKFHSFPLIGGLAAAGHIVRALGTTRRRPEVAEYRCCWPSALATQLAHRIPRWSNRLIRVATDRYEAFASRHVSGTRCFWGWSNHHLEAFCRAKDLGIPVILEVGSTDVRWCAGVLRREFEVRGVPFDDDLLEAFAPRMIAEYEIADRISVPSRFVAQTFIENGIPGEKLNVNPYGADLAFWAGTARIADPSGPRIFVFTGQIMLRKGIGYLLDAWRTLHPRNAELWFIGGIFPDAERLMRKLPDGVRHLGFLPHSALRDVYARADAYLLPSLEEGMARSVLEAMAAGVPVILTRESGATDIARNGEHGWVVPARDAGALQSAIAHVLADPAEAARRGAAARDAVKPYSWAAYGSRAAQFLDAVLAASKGK